MTGPRDPQQPYPRVDYDQIASSYDRRYENSPMSGVADALKALVKDLAANRVLDVGCGTGRYLADLPCRATQRFGLDLSAGMLDQSRRRGGQLDLVRGQAARLPFQDEAFDVIFCVNAVHHFQDPRRFVSEAYRSLRPGGALAVVGSNPHDDRFSWYGYEFFEGTLETDLLRFPSWGGVVDWMVAAGFDAVEWRLVERILDPKIGTAVFQDPFLGKNACSQLALLSDEAYAAGLRRIEAALERASETGEPLTFPVDMRVGAVIGRRKM